MGAARVRDLEDDLAGGLGTEDAIVTHSLAERVLCRYTAFVAVDDDGTEVTGPLSTVVQPVATPSGWLAPIALEAPSRGSRSVSAVSAMPCSDVEVGASRTLRALRADVEMRLALTRVDAAGPDAKVTAFLDRVARWRSSSRSAATLAALLADLDELIAGQTDAHGEHAPVVLASGTCGRRSIRRCGPRSARASGVHVVELGSALHASVRVAPCWPLPAHSIVTAR